MRRAKSTFLSGMVLWFWLGSSCAQDPLARQLTPAEEMELRTLTGQLVDPGRDAKTKLEAAELLLARPYPQAGAALKELLSDNGNLPAQTAIAEALARHGNGGGQFIEALLGLATGKEPSVRMPAVRALVTYKDEAVTERLIAIALDVKADRQVRLATIAGLQNVLNKKAVDALVRLLGDKDPAVAAAAAEALAKLTNIRAFGNDPQQWNAWWQKNKNKPHSEWLADLAESLARTKSSLEVENVRLRERLAKTMLDLYAATPPDKRDGLLLSFLKDGLADVRLVGLTLTDRRVSASDKLPPEIVLQTRLMLGDADPRVRRSAALLTAGLRDAEALGQLLERLKAEEVPQVQEDLLAALGQLRDLRSLPAVLEQVRSGYDGVAGAAASALARIADKQQLEPKVRGEVAAALLQRYRQVGEGDGAAAREALLTAMGVVGDKAFVPVLFAALKDPAATVRLAAVNGLAQMRPQGAAELVQPLAESGDVGVRQAAIAALGVLDGQKSLQIILQQTDPSVDAAVRQKAWDVAMLILAQAPIETLSFAAERLADRPDATVQRIRILQMRVDRLKPDKGQKLADAQRQLGQALVQAARPAEAAPQLAEAHAIYDRQGDAKGKVLAGEVWLEWVGSMQAAGDPGVVKVMAEQADPEAFAQALGRLFERLTDLGAHEKHATAIALAREALKGLAQRLTEEQVKALERMLSDARAGQAAADRERVGKLVPQLLAADEPARQVAAAEVQAMGDRAVTPLLEEFRRILSADKPNPEAEKAILAVIAQVAPKLAGYDPSAPKEQRIGLIDSWLQGR